MMIRLRLLSALLFLIASSSFQVLAQCNPVVVNNSGEEVDEATFCQREPIQFLAKSPGYTTTIRWDYANGDQNTTQKDNYYSYSVPGTYTVIFTGTGPAGTCVDEIDITIKPSPDLNMKLISSDSQCFNWNQFCLIDSSTSQAPIAYDSTRTSILGHTQTSYGNGDTICFTLYEPNGGHISILSNGGQSNGCTSRQVYHHVIFLTPRIGADFDFLNTPNPGCDSTTNVVVRLNTKSPASRLSYYHWKLNDDIIRSGSYETNKHIWDGWPNSDTLNFVFPNRKNYKLQLMAQDSFGCFDSLELEAKVSQRLKGSIKLDSNGNCTADGFEQGIYKLVVGQNASFTSDNNGNFSVVAENNTSIRIEPILSQHHKTLVKKICPPFYDVTINNNSGCDSSGFDFAVQMHDVSYLRCVLESSRRRRCTRGFTKIEYINDGKADQDSVKLFVKYPQYLVPLSADLPYTLQNGLLVFDLGEIKGLASGTITIRDSVACVNASRGTEQCVHAWMTPENQAFNQLNSDYSNWDGSSLTVSARKDTGDARVFVITNTSNADMTSSSTYRLWVDAWNANYGSLTRSFKLNAGDSLVVNIPKLNPWVIWKYWSMKVNQPRFHPIGRPAYIKFSSWDTRQVSFPPNFELQKSCNTVVDSYDPNDKKVNVQIEHAPNVTPMGSALTYTIRFQNTGTDTAYRVVIEDLLDRNLDLASLELGVSSHEYTWQVESENGRSLLRITFEDVNLLPKSWDEAKSQGFVMLKVHPKADLQDPTYVQNYASIYFDYNDPIITNTTQIKYSDRKIEGIPFEIIENGKYIRYVQTIKDTFCHQYEVPWNSNIYITPGVFYDTLRTDPDSIVIIELKKLSNYSSSAVFVNDTLHAQLGAESYQWLDCENNNKPIVGANKQYYVPSSNGSFAVETKNWDCIDTSKCVHVEGLKVSDIGKDSHYRIRPNPAESSFQFDHGVNIKKVNIYNQYGQLVKVFSGGQKVYQIGDLASGMYVVQFEVDNRTYYYRLVKR